MSGYQSISTIFFNIRISSVWIQKYCGYWVSGYQSISTLCINIRTQKVQIQKYCGYRMSGYQSIRTLWFNIRTQKVQISSLQILKQWIISESPFSLLWYPEIRKPVYNWTITSFVNTAPDQSLFFRNYKMFSWSAWKKIISLLWI